MERIPVIDMTATGINITRLQRGTALPTVDNLVVLAAVFGVKIDDILIFQGCRVIQFPA